MSCEAKAQFEATNADSCRVIEELMNPAKVSKTCTATDAACSPAGGDGRPRQTIAELLASFSALRDVKLERLQLARPEVASFLPSLPSSRPRSPSKCRCLCSSIAASFLHASMSPAPPSSFQSLYVTEGSTSYPDYQNAQPQGFAEFLQRAQDVAALLASDVAQRDDAQEVPYKQVALLKDSGLVTALGAVEFGGGGLPFADGYKLARAVAAGDGSIGQLLAYHFLWSYTARIVGTEEQIKEEERRYTEGKLFYGAAVNPR